MSKRKLKEDNYNEIYGRKGYKEKSGFFAWLYSSLKRYEENRHQAVFKLLEKGEKLLDVGCGDGDFCIMAKGLFDDAYGVDVSNVRIMNAEKRISDRQDKSHFHFMQNDVDERLPFADDFFDTVTCIATLELVVYPSRVVMEMRRVLKPQGILIVQVENIAFLPYRLTSLAGKLPTPAGIDETGVDWDRLHSFTQKVLARLIRSKGFEIVALSCSGIFAGKRRVWSSLLAGDIIVKARRMVSNE